MLRYNGNYNINLLLITSIQMKKPYQPRESLISFLKRNKKVKLKKKFIIDRDAEEPEFPQISVGQLLKQYNTVTKLH